jgi:hypothetical protein
MHSLRHYYVPLNALIALLRNKTIAFINALVRRILRYCIVIAMSSPEKHQACQISTRHYPNRHHFYWNARCVGFSLSLFLDLCKFNPDVISELNQHWFPVFSFQLLPGADKFTVLLNPVTLMLTLQFGMLSSPRSDRFSLRDHPNDLIGMGMFILSNTTKCEGTLVSDGPNSSVNLQTKEELLEMLISEGYDKYTQLQNKQGYRFIRLRS